MLMNELKAIAEINEEIKCIVCAAENISLTATNAVLVARQAGINAIGFSVVARELRVFSENTALAMHGLSGLIYRQVVASAAKRHRKRSLSLLAKTAAYGELTQTRLSPACMRSQAQLDELEQLIANLLHELLIAIRRTGKQCATGLVISRSAEIEAAYGGVLAQSLRQVAQDAEEVITHIAVRVRNLESRLAEAKS